MQLNIFDLNNCLNTSQNNERFEEPNPLSKVEGLLYVKEFLSCSEHDILLNAINNECWITDLKRRVQHYGWKYDYKTRSVNYAMYLGELPDWVKPIAGKLYKDGYFSDIPDQLIINEYQPGQGIANHVDCEPCFGDTIVSISLGSKCVMDLINLRTKDKVELLLSPRSLIVLSGPARYQWTHGITSRKTDTYKGLPIVRGLRISLTFRNVKFANQ